MASKKELYDEAKAKGLDLPSYDDVTSKELKTLLGGDGSGDKKSTVLVNNRKNQVSVCGVKVEPRGSIELTDEQLNDERLMAKLNHGVKTGVYSFK